ncbi:hypothetical protein Leryth_019193 [Lithospermum erythrorhizon]|nr:hypothetical protein Leryth_019193 [Lithospermum erythrorhizon]
MEKGWSSPLYQFQGFWHHPKMLQGFLDSQKHFQAQDSDVILITFPKSGTTLLKALLFSIINRQKHSPLSQERPLLTKNPHALVPFLKFSSTTNTSGLLATLSPIGLLPNSILESKCKLVYLSRNPKDTFVSYWHFAMNSRPKDYSGISLIEEEVTMFSKGFILC